MATFDELWSRYGRDRRPSNIGATFGGIAIGDLDDEIQDVAGSYAGLRRSAYPLGVERDRIGEWRVARLGLALAQVEQLLPAIEPAMTKGYFERLAELARAALGEIAADEA